VLFQSWLAQSAKALAGLLRGSLVVAQIGSPHLRSQSKFTGLLR
jgi:hypothetical protein